MTSFLQSIFKKLSPPRGPRTPQVSLGAFGKHPGWNDHIDDLGLDTEALISLKRNLYVQGIAGNIDAGAWDALAEDQQLPAFNHLFLTHHNNDLVVGRLWGSSDGKGRTKYPMIVAAHCAGLPLSFVAESVLPRLEQIHLACTETHDANAVRSIMDLHRQALRAQVASNPPQTEPLEGRSPLATLSSHPAMGCDGKSLLLVLYAVERELAAFRPDSNARATGPRHLRVPLCSTTPQEGMFLWLRFLLSQLDAGAPVMVIVPLEHAFADLIAGEPTPSQLFCFRASPKKVPLTTEIPYTMDEAFISRSNQLIAAAR